MLRLTKKKKQALKLKQELLDLISEKKSTVIYSPHGKKFNGYYSAETDKYYIHYTCYGLVRNNVELTWETLCKYNDYFYKLPRAINKINWNYQKKYDIKLVKQYAQMQKQFLDDVKALEPYYM
jgi:hypothetical protein